MKKKPTQQEIKRCRLARQIASDLFTNGTGVHCTRLQMLLHERDQGGWCEQAVRDTIERRLTKFLLAHAPR